MSVRTVPSKHHEETCEDYMKDDPKEMIKTANNSLINHGCGISEKLMFMTELRSGNSPPLDMNSSSNYSLKFESENEFITLDRYKWYQKSGDRLKYIGKINISKVESFIIIKEDLSEREIYEVVYYDSRDDLRTTIVDSRKLAGKNLIKSFLGFDNECKSLKKAENFLAWYINNIINYSANNNRKKVIIPSYTGFRFYNANGIENAEFWCNDGCISHEVLKLCSENIQKKYLCRKQNTVDDVVYFMKKYISSPERLILYVISLCGTLSSVFGEINSKIKQLFVINAPSKNSVTLANHFLQGFNREKNPLSFDSSKPKIKKAMYNARDETLVFNDCGVIDNQDKRSEIMECVMSASSDPDIQSHCTAVVIESPLIVDDSEKFITINVSDDFDVEMTQAEIKDMCISLDSITSFFIDLICKNYSYYKQQFQKSIEAYIRSDFLKNISEIDKRTTISIMIIISEMISEKCKESIPDIKELLIGVFSASSNYNSQEECIAYEFIDLLRSVIHSGKIQIIKHDKNMKFNLNNPQVIVKDDYLLITDDLISDITSKMKSTNKKSRIINSLNSLELLSKNKKNRYLSTVYCDGGVSRRISFYAVNKHDIIDDEIDQMISECEYDNWFLESPVSAHMVPIAINHLGKIVYQANERIDENMHVYFQGKSESGKTLALTERACSLCQKGNKVIIFDQCNSFRKEDIIRNLSVGGDKDTNEKVKMFVKTKIKFHDVEEEGIPVNMFKFDGKCTESLQEIIYKILVSHITKIGQRQSSFIKKSIKESIVGGEFDVKILYEKLTNESSPDNVKDLFTDNLSWLQSYTINSDTWDDVIQNKKNIVVISMNAISGKGGSSLVDMLLMSLFYHQRNSQERHIDIVVDEIQNQNLSLDGAIAQILREGRKERIGLNYATQFFSASSKEQLKVISQASLTVYLRQDDESAKSVFKKIGVNVSDLIFMDKGECYIAGELYNANLRQSKYGIVHGKTYRNFIKQKK